MQTTIPGNRYSEVRIWADTTKVYLEDQLRKVTHNQQANMRGNPRYVKHVRELRRAIEAR